jgi:ABC-type transporter Mla subunit MlaD
MDQRTYDFTTLSERISAQTEAYVEFSNALVKIIEQTANIRDRLSENNENLKDEYKVLNKQFQELLLDITKFFGENSNQHSLINKDLETFKFKLGSFETKMDLMLGELENTSATLNDTLLNLIKDSKESTDQIDNHNIDSKSTLTSISQILKTQSEHIEDMKKSFDKFKVLVASILSIFGAIGLLNAFKIISISWFVH